MSTYRVDVERDGRYWFVQVDGIGVTQGRSLEEVPEMARDLISLTNGDNSAELDLRVHLPGGVEQHLIASRELRQVATDAQTKAAAEIRVAARILHEQGVPLR